MDLENLGNNLDFVRLEFLGHHQSHQIFERKHLEVAFLILSWTCVDCGV
jgi:hypothetical protein